MCAMTSQCETGGLTRTSQSIVYPAEGKKKSYWNDISILAKGKSRVGLPPPFTSTKVGSRKSEVGSLTSEDPPRLSVVQDSVVVYTIIAVYYYELSFISRFPAFIPVTGLKCSYGKLSSSFTEISVGKTEISGTELAPSLI